jgi:hypothetical protein
MSAAAPQATLPRRSTDEHGRAIPMTEAEVRARAEAVARSLEALNEMGDEEEQRRTRDALMAALGGERPPDRE